MAITVDAPVVGVDTQACAEILRALPEWFGIEEATQHYIDMVQTLPTCMAYDVERVVGFLSIKQHSPSSAEIYVMAVHPNYHRRGVGRLLLHQAEQTLRSSGTQFLQVKTLSPSHPDPNYARTRQFYMAQGFVFLEEFPTLWGEQNPCLMLIKSLQ